MKDEDEGKARGKKVAVWDRAGMLDRLMDDEALASVVLGGFMEDMPGQIEALRKYLEDGDQEGAERQAHTMKGAAANVGAEVMREIAEELEMTAKKGELEVVRDRLPSLVEASREFQDEVEKKNL